MLLDPFRHRLPQRRCKKCFRTYFALGGANTPVKNVVGPIPRPPGPSTFRDVGTAFSWWPTLPRQFTPRVNPKNVPGPIQPVDAREEGDGMGRDILLGLHGRDGIQGLAPHSA